MGIFFYFRSSLHGDSRSLKRLFRAIASPIKPSGIRHLSYTIHRIQDSGSGDRGSFSYDYEGTGYLFEFIDSDVRDRVATALIRGGASVERRGDLELFVQL